MAGYRLGMMWIHTEEHDMKQKIVVLLSLLLVIVLAACASPAASPTATAVPASTAAPTDAPISAPTETAEGGMEHSMDDTTESDAPYDAMFMDGMTEHHMGAVTMAEQAVTEAEHEELRQFADAIIAAQTTEIQQMADWRATWYPDLPPTEGMMMDMGAMELSTDTTIPFDQRFLDAMTSHHQGAIDMARDALTNAEHEEIKTLAQAIITAQEAEIAQMQAWRTEWFGN